MSKITIERVLEKAVGAVENLDYPLAAKFYQRALEMEPKNTKIMDDYAQTLLELGETDRATELLKESINIDPEGGYEKYMNYGQILRGKEAVTCFEKGITLMTAAFQQVHYNDNEKKFNLSSQISTAYCSIAEIYLTDLCMEEGAEKECEKNVENAIKWNSENAEVFVLKTNLLLSQNKNDEATTSLLQSYSLWKHLDETKWPPYAIQLQTAKMMIELALSEEAIEVLELLVEQEDENSEVWYLLGLCYCGDADAPTNPSASYECLTKSRDLLLKLEERPAGALEQVEELLNKLTPFYNPNDDNDDNDGDMNDNDNNDENEDEDMDE